ncbi:MAG TPA: glycosyltransferase family 9 protein [Candidatus Acidoferrales bacterium]|nr:glycosyltransferase family 9 protein [Candidatus Acidoferrales bacterium]
MPEERFLLVRLGSLGDVIFTLPTLAALRDTFPDAQIDWVIDRRWAPLLAGNPDLSHMISLPDRSVGAFVDCARSLRASKYTCALDIQGLYKSALLARLSGTPWRIGFTPAFVREGGAAMFYTERVVPREPHMVGQNVELAVAAGARAGTPRFPLHVSEAARTKIANLLKENTWQQYAVLSPGGGWRSKCWPPERFGAVARILWERHGLRAFINSGPGESELARAVSEAAGDAAPVAVQLELAELMALLQRARIVIAADSGPLHLAVALGTPVVGLYGPTSPERNGPYSKSDLVVRNVSAAETTYKRRDAYSSAMLSISVEQVADALERRLGRAAGHGDKSP